MHPPFLFVDHRVGVDSSSVRPARSIPRRGPPQRFDIAPAPGFPPLPVPPPGGSADLAQVARDPALPARRPAPGLARLVLGRALVRSGEWLLGGGRPA